jgi:PKD repeat protein
VRDATRMGRIGGIVLLASVVGLVGCSLLQPNVDVDIAASETEGATPMVVEFSPVVAGEVAASYWDFGDGETSNEVNPVHVYRAAGTYDVFVSVTLADGTRGSIEKKGLIEVALIAQKGRLSELYWLNANNGTIHRGDRAGLHEETVVSYIYRGKDLAVGGGYVFWAADDCIYRAAYDGSGKEAIVTDQFGLWTVTVDGSLNKIYWAGAPSSPFSMEYWGGSLGKANLDGSGLRTIERYEDPDGPFTWWIRADSGGGRLYRYFDDYDTVRPRGVAPMAAGNGKLQYLVFTSATAYATSRIKTEMDGIPALAVDAGSDAAHYVYWIVGGSIRRCRTDGSDVKTIVSGLDTPRGVAADVVEGKMYWSDKDGIHRADLDGGNAELIYPGARADVLVIQEP